MGQCWCLCNGPWVAAGSLRSLSLDYHCCTHCWSERKVDSLILSVGCTNRGKNFPCYISSDWVRKKSSFLLWRLSRGVGAVCSVRAWGVPLQFFREAEVWELEVGLGWGTLVCVLAGSLLCVNGAELKASITERGSVKGMCRMLLGSSNGTEYEEVICSKKKKEDSITIVWNGEVMQI